MKGLLYHYYSDQETGTDYPRFNLTVIGSKERRITDAGRFGSVRSDRYGKNPTGYNSDAFDSIFNALSGTIDIFFWYKSVSENFPEKRESAANFTDVYARYIAIEWLLALKVNYVY